MGKTSNIEWTDSTWNPWTGCTKVSPGCKNCYAERIVRNFGGNFADVHRTKQLNAPLGWKEPRMVFTCSMSDFFHEKADPWRPEVWDIIKRTPQHMYQILTKRPERIKQNLPPDWWDGPIGYPNVCLGTSVEMKMYLPRLLDLFEVPAIIHFASFEPLLESLVDTEGKAPFLQGLDWAITGGESDYKQARPANLDWFRQIRDECEQRGIAYLHKQNGGMNKCPCHGSWGCRLLDGKIYDGFPDLMINTLKKRVAMMQ